MVIVGRDQKQQAAIGAFLPDLPLLFQANREVVNGVVARRFDGDHGNLGVRLLVNLGTQLFQVAASLRGQHPGKVVYVARGLQVIDAFRVSLRHRRHGNNASNRSTHQPQRDRSVRVRFV